MSEQRWAKEILTLAPDDGAAVWLAAQMSGGMSWLLAHADDGVIWGRWTADKLVLSGTTFADPAAGYPSLAVELRTETLQEARVFGEAGELLLWREGNGFRARRTMDGGAVPADAWQEQHILWGTRVMGLTDFTVLEEGSQGPVHAVPLAVPAGRHAALTVRHYIERDDQGQAYVCLSRLVRLGLYEERKES